MVSRTAKLAAILLLAIMGVASADSYYKRGYYPKHRPSRSSILIAGGGDAMSANLVESKDKGCPLGFPCSAGRAKDGSVNYGTAFHGQIVDGGKPFMYSLTVDLAQNKVKGPSAGGGASGQTKASSYGESGYTNSASGANAGGGVGTKQGPGSKGAATADGFFAADGMGTIQTSRGTEAFNAEIGTDPLEVESSASAGADSFAFDNFAQQIAFPYVEGAAFGDVLSLIKRRRKFKRSIP